MRNGWVAMRTRYALRFTVRFMFRQRAILNIRQLNCSKSCQYKPPQRQLLMRKTRAEYLTNELIPAVRKELSLVDGVSTLLAKLSNEPWRGGRKEAVIFQAERALAYHRQGQLVGIERFEVIAGKRSFLDLIVMESKGETIVEVKNWSGWNRWSIRNQLKRQIALERQILKYTESHRPVRIEFKRFVPDLVSRARILNQLIRQNRVELVAV
jgi:hypothetical protein